MFACMDNVSINFWFKVYHITKLVFIWIDLIIYECVFVCMFAAIFLLWFSNFLLAPPMLQ